MQPPATLAPPNPDLLTEPVVYEGQPVFPSGWSADEREEYLALVDELDVEHAALAEAKGEDAPAPSPAAAALAAKRLELDALRDARKAAEQQRADDEVFATLEAKHGKSRVGRIPTVSGTFFLRPVGEDELDKSEERAAALKSERERIQVGKQMTLDTVVHSTLPQKEVRARAAKHLADYPGDWMAFFNERSRLVRGVKDDAGKGA